MIRWIFGLLAIVCLGGLGCSSAKQDEASGEAAYAASGNQNRDADSLPQLPQDRAASGEPDAPVSPPRRENLVTESAQVIANPIQVPPSQPRRSSKLPERELRAGFSAKQLVDFLAVSDRDMQTIVSGQSGIEDPEEAREVLVQIVKMKLEASRRLARDAEAAAEMKSEGARGELQSLSHLAALGDLKAAVELEQLAEQNLASNDPLLVSDSRLVLIGFAIEQLQNGKPDSAKKIVNYVDALASSTSQDDVPAMMVMGEARDKLARYGHDDEAKRVRDQIIDVFANSPDAAIAQMAAQVAGNVQFDGIESLREQAMKGQPISTDVWRESVETLINESADLQTVQYLAGAALEFESTERMDLVDATYEVLAERFSDGDSSTGREVALASRAKDARSRVIGRKFDPDLTSVDGSLLRMSDYQGKVVLMPFWASTFPESLRILPQLKLLVDAHPDDITIVGINLDVEGADVERFSREKNIDFPSFRAESSATAQVANPVAAQFGLVSMPFVAILDRQGRVAQIDYTGRKLNETVETLLGR